MSMAKTPPPLTFAGYSSFSTVSNFKIKIDKYLKIRKLGSLLSAPGGVISLHFVVPIFLHLKWKGYTEINLGLQLLEVGCSCCMERRLRRWSFRSKFTVFSTIVDNRCTRVTARRLLGRFTLSVSLSHIQTSSVILLSYETIIRRRTCVTGQGFLVGSGVQARAQ